MVADHRLAGWEAKSLMRSRIQRKRKAVQKWGINRFMLCLQNNLLYNIRLSRYSKFRGSITNKRRGPITKSIIESGC